MLLRSYLAVGRYATLSEGHPVERYHLCLFDQFIPESQENEKRLRLNY